jgi:hypothetical protein
MDLVMETRQGVARQHRGRIPPDDIPSIRGAVAPLEPFSPRRHFDEYFLAVTGYPEAQAIF